MNFEPTEFQVFVFPLPNVTSFPATSQPLNIFEPRYVEMMKDAVAQDRPVALGQQESVGSVLGCGRVQILHERDDGTMLVLLRTDCKVRLCSVDKQSKPYIVAQAATVIEQLDLDPGHVFYLHRLMKELGGWLERNVAQSKRRAEFLEQMGTDEERVNTACSLLIEDPASQQKLLEIDDLNERIEALASLLETGAASH